MSTNKLIRSTGAELLAIVRQKEPEMYIPLQVESEFTDSPRGSSVSWTATFGRYTVSEKTLEAALDALRAAVVVGNA